MAKQLLMALGVDTQIHTDTHAMALAAGTNTHTGLKLISINLVYQTYKFKNF